MADFILQNIPITIEKREFAKVGEKGSLQYTVIANFPEPMTYILYRPLKEWMSGVATNNGNPEFADLLSKKINEMNL